VRNLFSLLLLCFFIPVSAMALPIDWQGVFGVDSTLIDNYRRIKQTTDSSSTNTGSQEVGYAAGNQASASFQSYIFRLQPTLIVNDAASIKGELSTNYARGGRFGDDSTRTASARDSSFGSTLYTHNTSSGSESVIVNQLYAELYSDAATWLIGRHSFSWGLGAVYDDGQDAWDRFATARDGVTAKIKVGNFQFTPYWAKIAQTNYTRASRIREYGASVLYDNVERDLAFGLLYGKKQNSSQATGITGDTNNDSTNSSLGATDVTITDIYFAKNFGDLSVALEVPLLSGEIGNYFENGSIVKYKAKALLLESSYKLSNKWKLLFFAGQVSGQGAGGNDFEAMYLHPNYQVANLMFRYDLRAISNGAQIYDSYVNNATYAKLGAEYATGKWTWDGSVIWAKADQTAQTGKTSYNHATGKTFTAAATQSDDLGTEFDFGFNYKWNNEVHVGASAGYLMTGDYYAFTNTATPNDADNTMVLQVRSSIEF
tara:strand:+ start:2053 stop:3510 length:1458 start_codon:yes stop_codon:yes gene_type:complete